MEADRLEYYFFPSAFGTILLLSRKGVPFRLDVRGGQADLQTILRRYPGARRSFRALRHVILPLQRYLEGKKTDFDFPLDLSAVLGFQKRVLLEVRRIPFGEVRSYESIAKALGLSKGQRAVGKALAANPLPILIPCHRVVRKDGKLGGYSLGRNMKETLLRLEGLSVREGFVHTT